MTADTDINSDGSLPFSVSGSVTTGGGGALSGSASGNMTITGGMSSSDDVKIKVQARGNQNLGGTFCSDGIRKEYINILTNYWIEFKVLVHTKAKLTVTETEKYFQSDSPRTETQVYEMGAGSESEFILADGAIDRAGAGNEPGYYAIEATAVQSSIDLEITCEPVTGLSAD